MTIDLEAAAAERERLRATYLQVPAVPPKSTAQGVHHLALLCSDVERTIRFYQELLGFPLVELFENRDYKGSTHLFFDLGHDNTLAFFDFPDLGLGPYAEVLGGFHHLAISVSRAQWEAARARLDDGRHRDADRERGLAVLLRSRRRAPRAHRRGPRIALRHAAALMAVTGLANLAVKVSDLEAGVRLVRGRRAPTVTEPVEWENGRRADVQLGDAGADAVHAGHLRRRMRAARTRASCTPHCSSTTSTRSWRATTCCGDRGRERIVRNAAHRLRRGAGRHPPRVHGAGRTPTRLELRPHRRRTRALDLLRPS